MESERLLLNKVENFIREKEMLTKEVPVLIGFSGGADSTALLDVLVTLGYKCIAAHCNFHLRGAESARDHEFARMKALEYGVPFYEIEFQTREYAESKGISIEMACRELRYEWFEELLQLTGAQAIAVAHHRDDSIETFFMNLLRGTGIAGLTGINAVYGNVVRPFSMISRRDIEDYLAIRHIDFITDSSNREDIYLRNKIRLQMIPLLKEMNPSACESVMRTIQHLQQTEKIYSYAIREFKNKVVKVIGNEIFISIDALKRTVAPKAVLFEILREYEVSSALIDDIYASLDGLSGKHFFAGDYRIVKDRDNLIISQREIADSFCHTVIPKGINAIQSPIELRLDVLDHFPGFVIPKEKTVACFDADKVQFPLVLRRWEQGDKFVPFGMRGMKKLSDYFSDHKYSLSEKERAWLLCSEDQIIWLVGERSDNRYRVTSTTKKVLLVTLS